MLTHTKVENDENGEKSNRINEEVCLVRIKGKKNAILYKCELR